jgi:hypothetical protein
MRGFLVVAFTISLLSIGAQAQDPQVVCESIADKPACEKEPTCYWDLMGGGMCMTKPTSEEDPKLKYHIHYFQHGVSTWAGGPRGGHSTTGPGMPHGEGEIRLGDSHTYLTGQAMLSLDPWLVGDGGTVLIGQVGESNAKGEPYLDRQHEHGAWGGIFMAGYIGLKQKLHSGDEIFVNWGPQAEAAFSKSFMHSDAEQSNPFATLGHHQAQDSSHQSNDVFTGGYTHGRLQVDSSVFSAREPEPTKKWNTAIFKPDSVSLRVQFAPTSWMNAGVSVAKMTVIHGDADHEVEHQRDLNIFAETHKDLPKGITWTSMNMWGREYNRDAEQDKVRNSFKQANYFKINEGKFKDFGVGSRFEVVRRNGEHDMLLKHIDSHGDQTLMSISMLVTRTVYKNKSKTVNADVLFQVTETYLPRSYAIDYGGTKIRQYTVGGTIYGMKMGERK